MAVAELIGAYADIGAPASLSLVRSRLAGRASVTAQRTSMQPQFRLAAPVRQLSQSRSAGLPDISSGPVSAAGAMARSACPRRPRARAWEERLDAEIEANLGRGSRPLSSPSGRRSRDRPSPVPRFSSAGTPGALPDADVQAGVPPRAQGREKGPLWRGHGANHRQEGVCGVISGPILAPSGALSARPGAPGPTPGALRP